MAEQSIKATPRPWIAEQIYDGGRTICTMRAVNQLFCVNANMDNLQPYESTEDNAALIVAAVNSYEALRTENAALREACEAALKWIDASLDYDDLAMDGKEVLGRLRAALEVKNG